MARTLTHELLADLHKGIAKTALLPVVDGKVSFGSLDFSDADLIYSIKDSFGIEWEEPTMDPIKVDQNDETIDTNMTEEGEVTLTANYPTSAGKALSYFFNKGKDITSLKGPDGETYAGASYFKTPKTVEASLMSTSQSGKSSVVFARFQITARYLRDTDTGLWYIGLTGKMLSNLAEGEGDFAVLKEPEGE